MKAYQIRVTYLTGRNVGHTYVLTKGGYVANEDCTHKIKRAADLSA